MKSTISTSAGIAIAGAAATLVTLFMAWPVVLHPAAQIYGREILGRHPEPYTFIRLFGDPSLGDGWSRPLTDGWGWLLGRMLPPVAAYNLVVLLSFPLAAMAAYALGRYLTRSHGAALIAGLAFAFSPAHLAHAAYHPDIAQTQWIALYVLALVAVVDRLAVGRAVAFAVATAALVLSNFYGVLFAAVMAPVMITAFWAIRSDADRNLWPVIGPSAVLAGVGVLLFWIYRPELFVDASRFGIPLDDIAFYRGRWWAYFTPPVDHRWLGAKGDAVFDAAGINLQLTELQLYLGYALMALALAAMVVAIARWKNEPQWRFVPAAIVVALVAALVSLGPASGNCDSTTMAPGCLIFRVAPMFRLYSRFGLVTQLMVSLAAGAGAMLVAQHSTIGRRIVSGLLVVAAFEYWPLPARAHDVLPTSAHRWLASMPDEGRTLDCYPGTATESQIPWMMQREVLFLGSTLPNCGDPQLGMKLAGMNVAQVLVRRSAAASKLPTPLPVGLTLAHEFWDSDIYAVSQTPPAVVTVSSSGFFGYEHSGDDWWQWMGPSGTWTVRNTTTTTQVATLSVNLVPMGVPRRVTVTMDSGVPSEVQVGMARKDVTLGPWTLAPGNHTLTFAADGEPVRPSDTDGSSDRRPLTVSFRNERWTIGDTGGARPSTLLGPP